MSRRRKVLLAVFGLVVLGGIGGAVAYWQYTNSPRLTAQEAVNIVRGKYGSLWSCSKCYISKAVAQPLAAATTQEEMTAGRWVQDQLPPIVRNEMERLNVSVGGINRTIGTTSLTAWDLERLHINRSITGTTWLTAWDLERLIVSDAGRSRTLTGPIRLTDKDLEDNKKGVAIVISATLTENTSWADGTDASKTKHLVDTIAYAKRLTAERMLTLKEQRCYTDCAPTARFAGGIWVVTYQESGRTWTVDDRTGRLVE